MKYSRDMEALLTLAALSTYLKNGMRCDHMSAFVDFAARLEGVEHPDQPITSADLSAWFSFNRMVLHDKLRLGPVGLRMWFQTLIEDLGAFPRQDIVLELLDGLTPQNIHSVLGKSRTSRLAA